MSKREIAAAAAKKYILSLDNATANPPADRYHSVITLITLGKAEEGENINREKFLQARGLERGEGGYHCPVGLAPPRPRSPRCTCYAVSLF